MAVTEQEYLKAKKIVEEYEDLQRMYGYMDAEDDLDDDWEEEEEDATLEEYCKRAATCTCGAWVFNSKGIPVHVADCYCGAE